MTGACLQLVVYEIRVWGALLIAVPGLSKSERRCTVVYDLEGRVIFNVYVILDRVG